MTAVGSTSRAEGALVRLESAAERLLAVAPLVTSYLVLCLAYIWHSYAHGSPWLFSDELEYTQISRSIAETGEATIRGETPSGSSLYTWVLAPVWWISDTETAYTAAKYLGAFVMASALFPAYGLARLLVSRGPALFAGVATAAIPMLGYSRLIVLEVLAYPFAALAFYVMAKALSTWSRYWLAATLLVLLVAPHVRTQLLVLWPTFAIAAAVALLLGPAGEWLRRRWGPVQWAAAAVGLAVIGHIVWREAVHHSWQLYVTTTLPGRMQMFSEWAWGAFVIGIGVLPAVAALAALWRPRDAHLPGYRALAGLLIGGIVSFGLYTVVKTTYLSTIFSWTVNERNLAYLSPLFFAATALVLFRPGGSPMAFAAAGALVGYLVTHASFALDYYPYFDAPGLSVLARLNREPLYFDEASIERILLGVVIGSVVLGIGALWARGRAARGLKPVLAGVAVLVIAWNLTGLFSFGDGINSLGNRVRSGVPDPPYWVDNVTGGKPTLYLGQSISDLNPLFVTEFWNRSIEAVGTLDGQAVGPGPTLEIVPYRRDGSVVNDPGVDYVLTDALGAEPLGRLVYETGRWRLYRVERPLRLRSETTGLYEDGWSGPKASYLHFGEAGREGVLEVVVSRANWTGPDKPGKVTLRVGSLVPQPLETIANPCRGGTCVEQLPRLGRLYDSGTWTAHSGQEQRFRFRVTTPFKLEVTVDPTFSPHEFGAGDARQLGVRLAVGFTPDRG
ncbi:MAG: hypothetical protein WD067_07250 [Gaiellaceae bacterium]